MRRKRRFTWLPTLGSAGPTNPQDTLSGRIFNLTVFAAPLGSAGAINTLVIPVVPDVPIDNTIVSTAGAQGRLVESLGNEWFLERIVGKVFLSFQLGVNPSDADNCLVGCGFFVARANDGSSGGGVDTVIGSASVAERNDNYSPLNENVIREPWIWRRTWMLAGATDTNNAYTNFPSTNVFYPGLGDGPHIDARSNRRIGNDERLWFAVSTCSLQASSAAEGPNIVRGYLDTRVLGALTKAHNKSNF